MFSYFIFVPQVKKNSYGSAPVHINTKHIPLYVTSTKTQENHISIYSVC